NVRDWTADWFDGEYYAVSPYENPQGPSTGDLRTVRGSSWNEPTIYRGVSDIASRAMALPQYTANDIGFRCAFSH
ncbi:MAG: SUMF1/EgtB/PvdO family nonheme iron enzyme, partial [Anaerolineaceae bacterium]